MGELEIKKAILSIESDIQSGEVDPNLSLSEKFDLLAQEIINNSYNIFLKAGQKGYRISEDDEYMQETRIRQLNIISGVYTKLRKLGRIADSDNKPNENFEKQLLQHIKKKRSTVGEIVRTTEVSNV